MTSTDGDYLRTLALAAEIHDGQVDKAGRPYLGHPIRVVRNVAAMAAEMAGTDDVGFFDSAEMLQGAILHDAQEDQHDRYEAVAATLPPSVRRMVDAVTRRPDETYAAFIERIAGGQLEEILIKLGDLRDNLDPARRALLPADDQAPPIRYVQARERLLEAVAALGYRPPTITSAPASAS